MLILFRKRWMVYFLTIEMRSVCTDPSDGPVGINHNLFLIQNLSGIRFILLSTSPERRSTL
jgi:hypothetical protein